MTSEFLSQSVSRRQIALGSVLGALTVSLRPASAIVAAAQQATPVGISGDYPEFTVTVTDSSFELSDQQIAAGYIRFRVTNSTAAETGAGLLAIPAGQSLGVLAQATPEPNNFLPPFFYTSTIVGGPSSVPPGETWEQIIHVPAGDWAVFGDGNQQPVTVTATTTDASAETPPTGDVVITETNFAFSGFEAVQPGNQVWEVTNICDQPHMLVLFQVPDWTTLDQVIAAVSAPEGATPEPGGLQQSDTIALPNAQILLQSQDTSVWAEVNIATGTYVAVCFVIDPETGQPHAMEGMINLFQIGGAATPGATPAA